VDLTIRTVDLPHCLAACWRPLTCPWPTLIGTIHLKKSLNHSDSLPNSQKNENTYYIPVPGLKVFPIFSRRTIYICNYLELWEVFFSNNVFILLWLTWRLPAPHCIFGSFLTQGLQGFRKQEEISLNVCYNFVIFKSFKQLLLYNIFCVYQDRFEVALVL